MNFFKRLFSRRQKKPIEIPPEFLEEAPPDWILQLRGRLSEEGNPVEIRVSLMEASRAGTAQITSLPREEGQARRSARTGLARPEIDRLLVILGFSFPEDITDVAARGAEGLPVEITIHHREPYSVAMAKCNLEDWLGSKKSGPPTIEIGRLLVEIQRRALPGFAT